jgi:hypothetical protein
VDGFPIGKRYLLHDRIRCSPTSSVACSAAAGVKCLRLPARSPDLNYYQDGQELKRMLASWTSAVVPTLFVTISEGRALFGRRTLCALDQERVLEQAGATG